MKYIVNRSLYIKGKWPRVGTEISLTEEEALFFLNLGAISKISENSEEFKPEETKASTETLPEKTSEEMAKIKASATAEVLLVQCQDIIDALKDNGETLDDVPRASWSKTKMAEFIYEHSKE